MAGLKGRKLTDDCNMYPWEHTQCAIALQSEEGVNNAFYVVLCRTSSVIDAQSEPEPWAWTYMMLSVDERAIAFDNILVVLAL